MNLKLVRENILVVSVLVLLMLLKLSLLVALYSIRPEIEELPHDFYHVKKMKVQKTTLLLQ